MDSRTLGRTGRQVSVVGLGCWQLGADWGDVGEDDALAVLHAALDSGVTFLDTADVYGTGRSESLIGRFIQAEKPKNLFVATKLGRFPDPGWPQNFSAGSFRTHTEASLKRLGLEALDLTQLHCIPPERLKSGEPFEWLEALKKEGKLKHYGASVESVDEALWCIRNVPG